MHYHSSGTSAWCSVFQYPIGDTSDVDIHFRFIIVIDRRLDFQKCLKYKGEHSTVFCDKAPWDFLFIS